MDHQNQTPQGKVPGKGLAIGSLVCGIISLFVFGIILGIVGISLSLAAKKQGFTGGIATAGLVLSIIGLALAIVFIIFCGGMMGAFAAF